MGFRQVLVSEPEVVVPSPPEIVELDHDGVEGEQVVAAELAGLEEVLMPGHRSSHHPRRPGLWPHRDVESLPLLRVQEDVVQD